MMPFISIITPTLLRPSLYETYRSIMAQTFIQWEWLIQIDDDHLDRHFFDNMSPIRKIWVDFCGVKHKNFGNTCRHTAWKRATGEYVMYLDDDNFLADDRSLERIVEALVKTECPKVAIFPILRHGHRFFPPNKPQCCHVDTANLVVRRDIGRWPDRNEYTLDGIFIEQLVDRYGVLTFPNVAPIVNMPKSSEGK